MKRVITAIFIVLSITGCSVINQTSTYELSSARGQSKAYAFYKEKLDTPRYMYAWSIVKANVASINPGRPVYQNDFDMKIYSNNQLKSGKVIWYGGNNLFETILECPSKGSVWIEKDNNNHVKYVLAANTEIQHVNDKPVFPSTYTFSDDESMFDDHPELTSIVTAMRDNAISYVNANNDVGPKETYMVSRESIPLTGAVTGDAKMFYQKYKLANTTSYKALQVEMDSANLVYGGKNLEITFTYRTYDGTTDLAFLEGAIFDGTRYWLFSQNAGFVDLDIWK